MLAQNPGRSETHAHVYEPPERPPGRPALFEQSSLFCPLAKRELFQAFLFWSFLVVQVSLDAKPCHRRAVMRQEVCLVPTPGTLLHSARRRGRLALVSAVVFPSSYHHLSFRTHRRDTNCTTRVVKRRFLPVPDNP